jgi:protein subunit release factor A
MRFSIAILALCGAAHGFVMPQKSPLSLAGVVSSSSALSMTIDNSMLGRLDGIRRSYQALTERLGDPDVLGDSKLLRRVMSERAQTEAVVLAYDEYCQWQEDFDGAKELFQEAGDDPEMKEMARSEMKEIEPKLEELGERMKILLLPKDPNDDRNIMLEIRAGTGGSEASIFAGKFHKVLCAGMMHASLNSSLSRRSFSPCGYN